MDSEAATTNSRTPCDPTRSAAAEVGSASAEEPELNQRGKRCHRESVGSSSAIAGNPSSAIANRARSTRQCLAAGAGAGGGHGADRRNQTKQPHLLLETAATATATAAAGSEETQSPPHIGIDLICEMSRCVDTGITLFNLCIAVGPVNAGKIRRAYLLDNEAYIVKSLRPLQLPESRDPLFRSWSALCQGWGVLHKNTHLFDKCRDNILAWMSLNGNWRERVTADNLDKYKDDPLRLEANVVFNNPAVAVEIGLLDAFRFLVEQKGIDLHGCAWASFVTKDFGEVEAEDNEQYLYENEVYRYRHEKDTNLVRLALIRGDIPLLQYLLSSDRFDWQRIAENGQTEVDVGYALHMIRFATDNRFVKRDTFECFIRHPKVEEDIDAIYVGDGRTLLNELVRNLDIVLDIFARYEQCLVRVHPLGAPMPVIETVEIIEGMVMRLIDGGADPCLGNDQYDSPFEYARGRLKMASSRTRSYMSWKRVVEKMESAVELRTERHSSSLTSVLS